MEPEQEKVCVRERDRKEREIDLFIALFKEGTNKKEALFRKFLKFKTEAPRVQEIIFNTWKVWQRGKNVFWKKFQVREEGGKGR